jgi:hypothetical protein
MKRLVATVLASVAALGLLSACGDDKPSSTPTVLSDTAVPVDTAVPTDTAAPDDTLPSSDVGGTVPEATIDLMIAQFEANGLKVDKACFTALLSDESMRKLVAASSGGTPSPEVIQKFISCMTP